MAKIKTYRTKHKNLWITIYLEDHGFASNLGLIIYKSKRAQNDWYRRRRNRRARRAAQVHNVANLRCWATCASLINRVLDSEKGRIYVYSAAPNREGFVKYLVRWGFTYSNGFWVRV